MQEVNINIKKSPERGNNRRYKIMKTAEKKQIKEQLIKYVERYGSQNKAAKSLKGVSSATLSQIINNNWELIKDEMWRNIKAQISYNPEGWQIVETYVFEELSTILHDAQFGSQVFAITGNAGIGKTATIKQYAASNRRTYVLSCNEYWNRKYFLSELLTQMGIESGGLTVAEMMDEIVSELKRQERPLIIMDEADKLKDPVLQFFITLYNNLEDICGLVMIATNHLKKRIERGVKLNKRGYKEIYSRIGRRFVALEGLSYPDVMNVCIANGLTDKTEIKNIFNECDGDLRRVKRLLFAVKVN